MNLQRLWALPLPYKKSPNQGPINVFKCLSAQLHMDVLENDVLAFALIERRRVLNVHMDMGSVAVAAVPALPEFLADGHVLAQLPLHASHMQVPDENVSVR